MCPIRGRCGRAWGWWLDFFPFSRKCRHWPYLATVPPKQMEARTNAGCVHTASDSANLPITLVELKVPGGLRQFARLGMSLQVERIFGFL